MGAALRGTPGESEGAPAADRSFAPRSRGSRGESLFYYQPATKVWKQVWVTGGAGAGG